MNNINCNIIEKDNNKVLENSKFNIDVDNLKYQENNTDKIFAQRINLELNYSLKYITNIMDYYKLKKTKLTKKQMIKKIIDFENCIQNIHNVNERKRLFNNYIELKNNKFFSKLIINQF